MYELSDLIVDSKEDEKTNIQPRMVEYLEEHGAFPQTVEECKALLD